MSIQNGTHTGRLGPSHRELGPQNWVAPDRNWRILRTIIVPTGHNKEIWWGLNVVGPPPSVGLVTVGETGCRQLGHCDQNAALQRGVFPLVVVRGGAGHKARR